MKGILQTILIFSFSLYVVDTIYSGLVVESGWFGYIIAGLVFCLGHYFIKPIIKIVTIPLQFLTLGLFSFFINGITLFVITLLYSKIKVMAFIFPGFVLFNFKIPSFYSPSFLSYVIISATIYAIVNLIKFIFSKE